MENGRRTIKTDLSGRISGIVQHLKVNEPLSHYTTWHIGGPAHYFVETHTIDELSRLRAFASIERVPFYVIGSGSNTLFSDKGFPGIVVKLGGDFSGTVYEGESAVAGAGVWLPTLVKQCAEKGLSGIECLAGIPGSVGGALVSNAGTSQGCIGDRIACVDVLAETGTVVRRQRREIEFGYRHSGLAGSLILRASINLKNAAKNDILKTISELLTRRSQTQPAGTWNAGSVFKNPPGDSAGRLIDACGLKGLAFGGAKISEKHANFIVNTGSATASDVRSLITIIHERVQDRFGISLELEIKIVEA